MIGTHRPGLQGTTPITLGVAGLFLFCVFYFIAETFFLAEEYYAARPPYVVIAVCAVLAAAGVFGILRWREPGGQSHAAYSVLAAIGFGLALYSFLPRLNIWTGDDGPREYVYTLDDSYVWQPQVSSLPPLRLYLHASRWWKQYSPGANYTFHLRRGGLGFWQVNMARIYADQKRYYDCDGVLSCMTK